MDGRRLELPTSALRTAENGETRDDEMDAMGCDGQARRFRVTAIAEAEMKLGKQPFNEVDDRACCEHDRDHCSSRDHNDGPASRFVLHRYFLTHFDERPHTRVQWLGKGRARYHTRIAESAATACGGTHRERNRGNGTLGEMVRCRERSALCSGCLSGFRRWAAHQQKTSESSDAEVHHRKAGQGSPRKKSAHLSRVSPGG